MQYGHVFLLAKFSNCNLDRISGLVFGKNTFNAVLGTFIRRHTPVVSLFCNVKDEAGIQVLSAGYVLY